MSKMWMPETLFSRPLKKKKVTSLPPQLTLKFVLGSQTKTKKRWEQEALGPLIIPPLAAEER